MGEETYGAERARRLVAAIRALAARISELETDKELLAAGPELLKRMGDLRSELFHHEVRRTYDTPEVAESRRIVEDALRQFEDLGLDDEDGQSWQDSQD